KFSMVGQVQPVQNIDNQYFSFHFIGVRSIFIKSKSHVADYIFSFYFWSVTIHFSTGQLEKGI
ncbi:MAG TPA: hypothetical protein PK977_05740, partial [Chitinophagaceae bacterium]|nr:hypothetical protein [Chitinophagaceae bacterium]